MLSGKMPRKDCERNTPLDDYMREICHSEATPQVIPFSHSASMGKARSCCFLTDLLRAGSRFDCRAYFR